MPTPIGHAMGGVAAGFLMAAVTGFRLRTHEVSSLPTGAPKPVSSIGGFGLFAVVGMLADIDLLFGAHRGATHSVGAILVVWIAAASFVKHRRIWTGCVVSAAYASHVILDWLGSDPSPPFGVMALWPLSREFYLSEVQVFLRVCREYCVVECWNHNVAAIRRELFVLMPVVCGSILVARIRRILIREA